MNSKQIKGSILFAILLLATAALASATTYVGVSDSNLVDQAGAVARVKVVAVEQGPASGQPSTDYLVEVEEMIKGHLPGSTITVRVPGGVGANGLALKIWGAPEFQPGDEPLLFLSAARDGSFHILHLMLGAFHARQAEKSEFAIRDLAEAHRLQGTAGSDSSEEPGVRDLERFSTWIADRGLGIRRPADYWRQAPSAGLNPIQEKYTETLSADGHPIRWFSFDQGGQVPWKLDPTGQPGLQFSQVVDALQSALHAWTDDPMSNIQYIYGGTGGGTGGLVRNDGVNTVLFNDPGNANMPQVYSCTSGGVVGIGGVYFDPTSTRTYHGLAYHAAVEGDVVINDGTECFFSNNPSGLAEVFAHELGHTLGFGHSADPQAVMRATAHDDGRGAQLGDDDRMAASVVYGDGSYQPAAPPPPPPGPTPPPPPPAAGPMKLSASVAKTAVTLAWTSVPVGITQIRIESQQGKNFVPMQTLPVAPSSNSMTGLGRNKVYVFRIAAMTSAGTVSGYSNVIRLRTLK
jgi:hypothetical protein